MIGYKATDMDGCCRGFKFEVGKTYTKDTKKEDLECCTDKVFHFCREIFAVEIESPYKLSESRLFEVMAGDFVRSGDKYGTNSLTILREITGDEKQELINSGNRNSGDGEWAQVWLLQKKAKTPKQGVLKNNLNTPRQSLKTCLTTPMNTQDKGLWTFWRRRNERLVRQNLG